MNIDLTARNANLGDLRRILETQHDVKYDVVADGSRLQYAGGLLIVVDGAAEITDEGVSSRHAALRPTETFEDGISTKLGIHRGYLRRMRETEELALLDHNVNVWLARSEKPWFIRGFRTDDPGETGIARAFLSDRYQVIDHLDALMATLEGIRKAGIQPTIGKCNLTESSMYVEIHAPEIATAAESLVADYRSPFTGETGTDNPIVYAGAVLQNSEIGAGAYQLKPRMVIKVCDNGMTFQQEAMRKVHLGTQLEEGIVKWSEDTQLHYMELIKNQSADVISTFLSQDYLEAKVEEVEQVAGIRVTEPRKVFESVGRQLSFSEKERDDIFDLFVTSGQITAGGVGQAMTAYAQVCDDADRQAELEGSAFDAMLVAARVR